MKILDIIPWAAQDELYEELSKVSNVAALSPHDRAVYDENLRQYRDNLAMVEAARLDGREEGREEGRNEIARNMLAKGFEIALIAEITNITEAEIEALK